MAEGRNERYRQKKLEAPRDEAERIARWRDTPWEEKMVYEEDFPPPIESVKITTVVPVHNELGNGNFWRILESAANQDAPSDTFEIILVVNNTLEHANTNNHRFQDNQTLIAIARALQEAITEIKQQKLSPAKAAQRAFSDLEKAGITVSQGQREIFVRAVERKLRFFAVDASSADRAPLKQYSYEYNIRGVARHIGGRIAYRRFHETGRDTNGLIDFIDADCSFPPNYYNSILETQSRRSHKRFFAKKLITHAPDIPEWSGTKPLERLGNLFHFLRQNITLRRRDYFGPSSELHGPAPIARADLFREVGGYTTQGGSEDFSFAGRLGAKEGNATFVKDTYVLLSDRTSETAVDGAHWQWSWIDEEQAKDAESFAKYFNPRNLTTLEGGNQGYLNFTLNRLSRNEELQHKSHYRALRAQMWKEEVEESKHRVKVWKQVIPAVVEIIHEAKPTLETFTDAKKYRAWLTKHLGGRLPPRTLDMLAENPIVMAAIYTAARWVANKKDREALGIRETGTAAEQVWDFFEKYLPEYFVVLPEEEPDYDAIRKSLYETRTLPPGTSLRFITHLARAQYEWELRDRQANINARPF